MAELNLETKAARFLSKSREVESLISKPRGDSLEVPGRETGKSQSGARGENFEDMLWGPTQE